MRKINTVKNAQLDALLELGWFRAIYECATPIQLNEHTINEIIDSCYFEFHFYQHILN